MTPQQAYESGQWAAFNRIMAYINTLEDKIVPKKIIYNDVADMRPWSIGSEPDGTMMTSIQLLDAYEAETKKLPLGHERPARGWSSYNWQMAVIAELRELLRSGNNEPPER